LKQWRVRANMGNYVRAVKELPKLRNTLQEVTLKRLQAERQFKHLKGDLDKKGQVLEQQRLSALSSSATATENLKKQMDQEIKTVQEDGIKLDAMTPLVCGDDDDDKTLSGRSRRRLRKQ